MPDIKVVDEQGEEISNSPESVEIPQPDATIPTGELMQMRVGQMFDLKPSELSKHKRALNDLIEYAKLKTDDHSAEGLKWAIRSLSTKLGTPPLGEKLLPYLQRYARLYMEGQRIDQQKKQYEMDSIED